MANFKKVKIRDHCEITSSKRIFAHEYLSAGVPFYRGKEISEKQRSSDEVSDMIYISKNKFEEIKSKYGVPQCGDLLLTSVGTIGNPYLVKDNEEFYFKDGNLTWFRNFDEMDSTWLYYWLLSPQGKSELNKCTIGSSQKAYTINLLYGLNIELPDLPTQTRIASVLSTYDDLIENNEKRIKALEEMAQLLYTEWFVKFKFPRSTSSGQAGHEKVEMIESGTEYGMVPEGWEVKNVESLIKRISVGKKYENKSVFETGRVPVLDQGKSGFIGFHNDEPGVKASLKNPVIVFANHTCYQNIIVYPFSAIQNVLPFIPNDDRNIFWLHWATKDLIEFNDYKGHWPEFMAKKLIVPSVDATKNFGALVGKYVAMRYELEMKNKNLSKTRDLLSLQLVTGRRELK